jgi:uncharacterized protein YidB (DUF937 family)
MIQELLKSLGPDFTQQFAAKLGVSPDQAQALLSDGVQGTLGGMKQQMASGGGLPALMQLLDRDGDGQVLDDVLGFLGGAGDASAAGPAGSAGASPELAAGLAQKLGLDAATVQKGLALIVPLVVGYLAKQRAQGADPSALAGQVNEHGNTDWLTSALGGPSGSGTPGLGNLLGKLFG